MLTLALTVHLACDGGEESSSSLALDPEELADERRATPSSRPPDDSAPVDCEASNVHIGWDGSEPVSSLAERVRVLIIEQTGVDPKNVRASARLAEDLGLDSLDFIVVVMALEQEFGIEIADVEADCLKSVGDISNYLVDRTTPPSPANPSGARPEHRDR